MSCQHRDNRFQLSFGSFIFQAAIFYSGNPPILDVLLKRHGSSKILLDTFEGAESREAGLEPFHGALLFLHIDACIRLSPKCMFKLIIQYSPPSKDFLKKMRLDFFAALAGFTWFLPYS